MSPGLVEEEMDNLETLVRFVLLRLDDFICNYGSKSTHEITKSK